MKHLFIAIFLCLASVAPMLFANTANGKAPVSTATTNDLEVLKSTYKPVKLRDPFAASVAGSMVVGGATKTAPSYTGVFQLQGILYSGADSSAIINDKLVTLNKAVTIHAGGSDVPVKAIEIDRDRVVLEVGGQKMELRLKAETGGGK